jgi:hypothetical protein
MSASSDAQALDALALLIQSYEDKVFSEFDRETCSQQALRDFRGMLRKRLLQDKPPPTVEALDQRPAMDGGLRGLPVAF